MAKDKQFEPEANFKPMPDEADLVPTAGGTAIAKNNLTSLNYIQNKKGWRQGSDGSMEINGALKVGNDLESTNFKKLFTEPVSGVSIYLSDQTTPEAVLTAIEGSICLNCSATGQMAYNDDGATSWTLL